MEAPPAVSNRSTRTARIAGAMRGGRRTSLRRRITVLARVGLALQLLLVVLVVATAVLAAQDGVRAAGIRETEDVAANLLSSVADQQTGLLTYLKPAQPDSLLLYAAGRVQTKAALAELRDDTRGTRDAALMARVEAAVRNWQRWAENLHAQQQPITDRVVIAEGSHLSASAGSGPMARSSSPTRRWRGCWAIAGGSSTGSRSGRSSIPTTI